MFTKLEIINVMFPGGAIYQVIKENSDSFLLGLGLWDRENDQHTQVIKDSTPGQVVRIDAEGNILARSPYLDNIIYQLQNLDDGRIFVGCRNSSFYYLNNNLTIRNKINIPGGGLYFWHKKGDILIATMRSGSLLFFNLKDDSYEILPITDESVRMWALFVENDHIVCGSYDGDLVLIEDRKIAKKLMIEEKRNSIWAIEKFKDKYWVGTANGNIYFFDQDLSNKEFVHKNIIKSKNSGITCSTRFGDQIIFGDLNGNLHFFNPDKTIIDFDFNLKCKTPNTIWWITPEIKHNLIRVAYSNGSLETFKVF